MKAVVMHEHGGPDVLRYETVPTPEPGQNEVLVRIHAATVNHTDIFHRTGKFFIQKRLPHILGMDVAGEIVEYGPGAERWRIGERVTATFEALGRERDGAYAQFTALPAAELHRIPDQLNYVTAAGIGLAFTTAWIAFFQTDHLGDREQVVVHAAASGVGTSAVQIAHWKGAHVVAISEGSKAERIRALGADAVIDRNARDLTAQVLAAMGNHGATFVLDLIGRATMQSSIDMLADHGRIVCVGTLSGDIAEVNIMDLMMKRGIIKGSFGKIRHHDFETILNLFADGKFRPVIDSVVPLNQAPAAHERIEARQAFGKIVLVPGE